MKDLMGIELVLGGILLWTIGIIMKREKGEKLSGWILLGSIYMLLLLCYSLWTNNWQLFPMATTLLMQHVCFLASPFLIVLLIKALRRKGNIGGLRIFLIVSQLTAAFYLFGVLSLSNGDSLFPLGIPITFQIIILLLLLPLSFLFLFVGVFFILFHRKEIPIPESWYPKLLANQIVALIMVSIVRL